MEDRFFDGDARQLELARSVARHDRASGRLFYQTGNLRFDGQSAIAIHQMTILGLGQIVLDHPEAREELLPAMQSAADRLVDPRTLAYAASVYELWNHRHASRRRSPYLGYINLALGMLRAVDRDAALGCTIG
jgi:hypothetical protein